VNVAKITSFQNGSFANVKFCPYALLIFAFSKRNHALSQIAEAEAMKLGL
jgi:hypothetical protein